MRFGDLFQPRVSPEKFHKELLKIAPFMKSKKISHFSAHDGWEFGTEPAGDDGYYADPSISGIYLTVPKDPKESIDFADIGIQDDLKGQGYGAKIVALVLKMFPKSKITVSDGSDGFWTKMAQKFPGRFELY